MQDFILREEWGHKLKVNDWESQSLKPKSMKELQLLKLKSKTLMLKFKIDVVVIKPGQLDMMSYKTWTIPFSNFSETTEQDVVIDHI